MSGVYDNWNRLVEAVLKREELRRLAYCESLSSSVSDDFSSRCSLDSFHEDAAGSLKLPLSGLTSFRIDGIEGEVDQIFRHLGLRPEDFSIPVAAWEARKSLSSPSSFIASKFGNGSELLEGFSTAVSVSDWEVKDRVVVKLGDSQGSFDEVKSVIRPGGWGIKGLRSPPLALLPAITQLAVNDKSDSDEVGDSFGATVKIGNGELKNQTELILDADEVSEKEVKNELVNTGGWEIRGTRPPKLAPPPVMMRSVVDEMSSTWDIFRALGPQDDHDLKSPQEDVVSHSIKKVEDNLPVERRYTSGGQEEREDAVEKEQGDGLESCSGSLNGGQESDSVPLIRENDYNVSPNGSSLCIKSWQKGDFLGSGSYGTVYEGFTDNGYFFAVKEVSLLDQGSQGRQSLGQLEQEVSLLRQFRHENIVRYLGTYRDDAKLYIFLELVTKGSLVEVYEKYQLRDCHVSAYTRQILNGLNYLHSRNVVHRDIKCANVLVDVSGSVKLADFGLAKAIKLNGIKSCKGTPYLMAPEVTFLALFDYSFV
ncbi:Mitogen-activated protein kinase kinase kinase [Handroanthus impetiginosus]|uniref:mitogen-activated protein kinase kinase kinase n=1 Tax=Handroanthus impetiginosus TaxID=429701 RepID=A0A2G9GWF1_9LAMI|nr:Mitogen-activated protein kinase kinase kinase [Handroanthus impetiginosus]